ncbi:MAG: nitrate/nitrite transporter NrtS [Acidobacteriota bacterium]
MHQQDSFVRRSLNWMQVAQRRSIVMRSLRVSLVVGTILVAINYADRVPDFDLHGSDLLKVFLTYCVPYCVSTYASVSEVLQNRG